MYSLVEMFRTQPLKVVKKLATESTQGTCLALTGSECSLYQSPKQVSSFKRGGPRARADETRGHTNCNGYLSLVGRGNALLSSVT